MKGESLSLSKDKKTQANLPNDEQQTPKTHSKSKNDKPNQPESSSGNLNQKVTNLGKNVIKNKALSKIENSDGVVGKTYRAAKKTINTVVKTKKYAGWLIKFVTFCVSNPLGWIVGIITLVIIIAIADDISDSVKDTLKFSKQLDHDVVYQPVNHYDPTNASRSGAEVVTILNDCKQSKSKSTGETSSGDAADADWTKEGTLAYKNAKALFDAWVDAGLSGEAAAGIIGWVDSEGGFGIIGRAEGHYGAKLEENSIKYGIVPIPSTSKYDVGGGGIYQYTPYTKYAPLSADEWEDGTKMTQFAIKEVARGDWNPAHDMTGGNHSFEQMAQETDPEQAALMWNAYERGDPEVFRKALPQKKAAARKANEVFNKEGHKFDRAKFEKNFKSTGEGGSSSSSSSKKSKCGQSSSGGKGWSKDRTGKHNYHEGASWKPEDLPEDLKQYALNPESIGMKFGSSEGWEVIPSRRNDQCTDLSASLMYQLWRKSDGSGPKQAMGNGIEVAKNWASTYGGSTTDEPTSGAVFSSLGTDANGHTGVVSHVFEDGSILIIEQNLKGLSGWGNGTTFTWNYRIVTVEGMKKAQFEFYDPSANGMTVNENAVSM